MKHLSPAYLALVMATGVISIAAWDFGLVILATGLFAFNVAAYAVLTCLFVLRAIRYPRLFLADMTDHRLAPGFFTAVAGSCILGAQFSTNHPEAGDCNRAPGARHRASMCPIHKRFATRRVASTVGRASQSDDWAFVSG